MVAYATVLKDNIGYPVRGLFEAFTNVPTDSLFLTDAFLTSFFSVTIMLPLSMQRELTYIEVASVIKLVVVNLILVVLLQMYFTNPGGEVRQQYTSFTEDWLVVRPGLFRK